MMSNYVIGIDQSTQGTKVLLFDDLGNIVYKQSRSHAQIINKDGWISHDLDEIYQNVILLMNDLVQNAGVPVKEISGIGLSVQRETAAAWAKDTGKSLTKAIVWQDGRAVDIVELLQKKGIAHEVKAKTGLTLSPYFTAAKLSWMLKNVPEVQTAAINHNLCMGTMDTWLLYRLTHGRAFKTEPSNASRTQLLDINKVAWDSSLCHAFGVPLEALATIEQSNTLFGKTDFEGIFPKALPIHCMLGDSQAALYGQGCENIGDVKATIGTGSSVMMNIGDKPVQSSDVVTSIGWKINGQMTYVAEGNINYAGAVVRWLVNDLKLIDSANQAEALARQAIPEDHTCLVPAFSGLGAPYWNTRAKATLTGMTRTTGRPEVVRAALDSIAFQINDILNAIDKKLAIKTHVLKVDGGVTANAYLMQFQSNMSNLVVDVPDIEELSAFGVAYCAGRSMMVYGNLQLNKVLRYHEYRRTINEDRRQVILKNWQQAIEQVCQSVGGTK